MFARREIYESANGDVALGTAEPHFFQRTLRAFGVDGCHDAIRSASAGETAYEPDAIAAQADIPLNRAHWRWSMPILRCPTEFVMAQDRHFVSPNRPQSSIHGRIAGCQAGRTRLRCLGHHGKENARRSEVVRAAVRRDRFSGTAAESIAALNSTAGSSFGDRRALASAPGRPEPDETVPKTAVPPLFCTLRLPAGTASARRTYGQQVFRRQPRRAF
jgi:hypothetical protein